jgi:hypothetical protein
MAAWVLIADVYGNNKCEIALSSQIYSIRHFNTRYYLNFRLLRAIMLALSMIMILVYVFII